MTAPEAVQVLESAARERQQRREAAAAALETGATQAVDVVGML